MEDFVVKILNKLKSKDKEMIFEASEQLLNIFDSYYKWNEQDYITVMNAVILICTLPEVYEDKKTFEELMDVLHMGAGKNGTELVNFDPLIDIFANGRHSELFDQLIIILGYSCQPEYIDYLNSIDTDSDFLQKEIKDAVYELTYFKNNYTKQR